MSGATDLLFYEELLGDAPVETALGFQKGSVGMNSLRALISQSSWTTYANIPAGATVPSLWSQSDENPDNTQQNSTQLVEISREIWSGVVGTLRHPSVVNRQTKSGDWYAPAPSNALLEEELLRWAAGTITLGVLRDRTGIDLNVLVKDVTTVESLKTSLGDTISGEENARLTVYNILAKNFIGSKAHASLMDPALVDNIHLESASALTRSFDDLKDWYDYVSSTAEEREEARQIAAEIQAQGKTGFADQLAAAKQEEEEVVSDIKFRMQSLLAAHAAKFAKLNKDQRHLAPPFEKDGPPSETCLKYKKTYMLDSSPSEIVNKLTYVPGSYEFTKITVPELSSLVPMIRLYKVNYNSKGEHVIDIPVEFSSFTNPDDLAGGSADLGRSGVGIKSFDWQYNGTNIATTKNDITAKIVLYFQNFNDLLKVQPNGFKYVDLLVRTKPGGSKDSDRSIDDAKTPDTAEDITNLSDAKYFEIKADLGWAFNPDYADSIHGAGSGLGVGIAGQRVVLFLGLQEHEFSVSQDGTFELTINYRGRIDGIMMDKRSDIIITPEVRRTLCELDKKLEEAKGDCSTDNIEEVKKQIRLTKSKAKAQSGIDISEALLKSGKIYTVTLSKETLQKRKFKLADITMEDIGGSDFTQLQEADVDFIKTEKAAVEEFNKKHQMIYEAPNCNGFVTGFGMGLGLVGFAPEIDVEEAGDSWSNCLAIAAERSDMHHFGEEPLDGEFFDDDETRSASSESGAKIFGLELDQNGDMVVPYFFFGDLVDIAAAKALGSDKHTTDEEACGGGYHPNRVDNLGIILGTMKLAPYGEDEQSQTINIGDIPISYAYFKDFWDRHVQKTEATTYPLIRFLRECIKDFVIDAVGGEVLEGRRPQKLMMKDASVSIPAMVEGLSPIEDKIQKTCPKKYNKTILASRLSGNDITAQNPMAPILKPYMTPTDMFHYKVFYLVNEVADPNLKGDRGLDAKSGIQHLVMGATDGILKEAQFKRTTQKGLREQRVVDANEFNPLKHLADVYNITAKMVGNVIFYPGQLVYLNPIGFGTKLGLPHEPNSPSRAMGLGGYHVITQVSSFIENGKFETTVEALWETSGGENAPRANNRRESEEARCTGASSDTVESSPSPPENPEGDIADAPPSTGG